MYYILTVCAGNTSNLGVSQFSKNYTLPNTIDPLTFNSILAADGILYVEAPTPEAIEAPRETILSIIMTLPLCD